MKRKLLFFSALIPMLAFSAQREETPKLTLSASATIWKPADELQLKVGVVTQGPTAETTLQENNDRMRSIVASLEMSGLSRDEYETSQFSIKPMYASCPENPPAGWRPYIIGYEAANSILIHTEKLDMAGKIIDLANRAGASSIADIRFGLRSPRNYWTEALAAAGSNAVKDALALAEATGVRLLRVLSVSHNHTQIKAPQLNLSCLAKAASSDNAPPIEAGMVSIEANVTVVYEVE